MDKPANKQGRNASVNERASVVIHPGTLVHTRVSANKKGRERIPGLTDRNLTNLD